MQLYVIIENLKNQISENGGKNEKNVKVYV